MRENFTLSFSNGGQYLGIGSVLVSLIVSAVIIFPILGSKTVEGWVAFIILFFIIYVLVKSMSNENLSNELPSTLYPLPPRRGLDGISLTNYVAGMDTPNYIM
jgi:hypothetical protein